MFRKVARGLLSTLFGKAQTAIVDVDFLRQVDLLIVTTGTIRRIKPGFVAHLLLAVFAKAKILDFFASSIPVSGVAITLVIK